MKLIDKDALVAKIERLISNGQVKLQESQESNDYESYVAWAEHIATCIKVLSFLDTLEVKEVDLDYIKKELDELIRIHKPNGDFGWGTLYNVATHFFELGLKTQKGE